MNFVQLRDINMVPVCHAFCPYVLVVIKSANYNFLLTVNAVSHSYILIRRLQLFIDGQCCISQQIKSANYNLLLTVTTYKITDEFL